MTTAHAGPSAPPWLWQTARGGRRGGGGHPAPAAAEGRGTDREVTNAVDNTVDAASRAGAVLREALLLDPPGASLLGLSVSVTYAPAFADQGPVGGDFFDAFALPGGKDGGGLVALLVGDMAGKGLAAAVHIAAVKFALRAFLREPGAGGGRAAPPCPGAALSRLNDFVCQCHALDDWGEGALASAALVILDTHTGTGRFALAAAEAPMVLAAGGGAAAAAVPDPSYGPPLGALEAQAYAAMPLALPAGASLLLFTDGLTEARRPGRSPAGGIELLGYDGVARLATDAHAAAGPHLPRVGRDLMERARAFGGGHLRDDACLLIARRER